MSEVVSLGKCPACKEGDIVEKKNSFACSKAAWKNEGTEDSPSWKNEGCNYSIYKSALLKLGGEDLTAENIKELLSKGSFSAKLEMTRDVVVDPAYGVKVEIFKK